MADIKLGISGSETTLPQINWMGSEGAPDIPTDETKNIAKIEMSDGSRRYANLIGKKRWILRWDYLSYAEIEAIGTLKDYNQILRFQNNWESADYFNVVVTKLIWEPIVETYVIATPRYKAELYLEEA